MFNLGAQSHVAVSFETPEYRANSDALVILTEWEEFSHINWEKVSKDTKSQS